MARDDRDERLWLLRFPLIVSVVYLHAYETTINLQGEVAGTEQTTAASDFVRDLVSQGLARTAVPLFFMMAGYFFFRGFHWSIECYRRKISSRSRSLLVPLLFWNAMSLVVLAVAQHLPALRGFFSGENKPIADYTLFDYVNALVGLTDRPIAYQFWFIRDLFLMVLLSPLVFVALRFLPQVLLAGLCALWFFNLWPIFVPSGATALFFCLGAHFSLSEKSLFFGDRAGWAITAVYFVLVLADAATKGESFNPYLHKSGLLCGMMAVLFLTKFLLRLPRTRWALLRAGSCSFFVFAVHEPLLTVLRKVAFKVTSPESDLSILMLYLAVPLVVVSIALIAYVLLRKIAPGLLKTVAGTSSTTLPFPHRGAPATSRSVQ